MATINISNLNSAGSELFADAESYLRELSDHEVATNKGGTGTICVTVQYSIQQVAIWYVRHNR